MANGTSMVLLGAGALFGYAAISGKSPLQAFFYATRGTDPRQAAQTQGIALPAAGVGDALAASGGGAGVVVAACESALGKPYSWAQPSDPKTPNPKSFDCSGLAQWSWLKAGVKISHNTVSQINTDKIKLVPLSQVQPADLVFFGSRAAPHHVGVYVGGGEIIEAPDYGIPVRRRKITAKTAEIVSVVGRFPGGTGSVSAGSGDGGTPSANKALGKMLAAQYGWSTGAQWDALDKLFTKESSWNNTAENSSSGAYGIAQALPPTKYPKAAQKPTSSATAQINWGLKYIKGRYGSPVAAWNWHLAHNWY